MQFDFCKSYVVAFSAVSSDPVTFPGLTAKIAFKSVNKYACMIQCLLPAPVVPSTVVVVSAPLSVALVLSAATLLPAPLGCVGTTTYGYVKPLLNAHSSEDQS